MPVPRVSIICAFYNAGRFLEETIQSVLAQELQEFELLLVDDGSTDSSAAIALKYADRYPDSIRYLEHPRHANRGASPSRNLGLSHARGEFIAQLDSDDCWRPHKLSEQVAIMDACPRAGLVCGTVNYWRSWDGGSDQLVPTGIQADGPVPPERTIVSVYPFGVAHAPCPSDALIRKSLLIDVGGFVEEFTGPLQLYEDQALFTKLYLEAPAIFASGIWTDYRQHPDSCVSRVNREGLRVEVRRYFLDWFARYVETRHLPRKDLLLRAVARARWELDHPIAGKLLSLQRRAALRLRRGAGAWSA